MSQRYKNIYFSDYPADSSEDKSLTVAFGDKDKDVYESIRILSSYELRELIGCSTFGALQQAAKQNGLAINTYCLQLLRQQNLSVRETSTQFYLPGLPDEMRLPIEPIQATFKGGETEPLHSWYPYLEGYSPGFVEQVLQEFAPHATRILDPFAGTGTTPLTVAKLGRDAFFCELNPLLQYLTEVKATALTLAENTRKQTAVLLRSIADHLDELLVNEQPDMELELAYSQTFGDSRFFDDDVYDQVLRARTAIDRLACTEPLAAQFLTIAVLSNLVRVSRLIRRGDVRYKTEKEVRRNQVSLIPATQNQLIQIASDLEVLFPITRRPTLVCEDARHLTNIPQLNIEAVITSPPYLNGTNYFRNTKIELWFLRCLRSAEDLSRFRYKAVTAGINDVTVSKVNDNIDEPVREIVSQLEASAYDTRIPRMVASYFADMGVILDSLKKHLVDEAVVVIDIGDSWYSKVHVPTNVLLTNTLISRGFILERNIRLRRRMSRGGSPLQQVLLVFRLPKRHKRIKETTMPLWATWNLPWSRFKEELPHQSGNFAKRNWGHPLHSLCSYQGKMKPSLASHLVKTFLPNGGTLLDPFGGVGTIPFEAALQGCKTWSFEISPAALHIASGKLGRPEPETCERVLCALEKFIQEQQVTDIEMASAQAIHFNGSLPDYFEPKTFREILLARRYFQEHIPHTSAESLVLASLLHILHGNRPYALSRRSHPITPFAPSGLAEYRALVPRLYDKVRRSLNVNYPDEFVQGQVLIQDATSWWPQQVNQLDAIITSPPFFDSTRFYLANWMRLWFCGWEVSDFRTQPLAFVDERQKTSFQIYEPIFRQARERLKLGGVMVLHLGKSRKCDMAQALSSVASRWFHVADIFTESVSHCESHGIRDKGTVVEHQYLVLE